MPGSLVSVLVLSAGLGILRDAVQVMRRGGEWSAMELVGLLWLVWGLALAAATLAFHLRRRGGCARCGRA